MTMAAAAAVPTPFPMALAGGKQPAWCERGRGLERHIIRESIEIERTRTN